MNEMLKGEKDRPVKFPKGIEEDKSYSLFIKLCRECTLEDPQQRPTAQLLRAQL